MKFESEDKRYLEKREAFSDKSGQHELWSVIDHWPLYAGISNIARFMAISDLLRSTLDVPGHVAEFGSWRGANLMFMAKLLNIYDTMGSKVVHCFDGFEGLTTFTGEDGEADGARGAYAGNYEELVEMIQLYQLQDAITIHKGLIQNTLPELMRENESLTFSFVYCDTDLFKPTELILEHMSKRLSKGGLFVFDEWNDARWPGEGVAANSFMREHSDDYEMLHIKDARQPTMALRKLRF